MLAGREWSIILISQSESFELIECVSLRCRITIIVNYRQGRECLHDGTARVILTTKIFGDDDSSLFYCNMVHPCVKQVNFQHVEGRVCCKRIMHGVYSRRYYDLLQSEVITPLICLRLEFSSVLLCYFV